MLQSLLDPARYHMSIAAESLLTAEIVALVEETEPTLLCIATLAPGGIAQTRLLCRRLRARFDSLKILILRLGDDGERTILRNELGAVGADEVVTTLAEARSYLSTLVPDTESHQVEHASAAAS
jgi:hypothetical protein